MKYYLIDSDNFITYKQLNICVRFPSYSKETLLNHILLYTLHLILHDILIRYFYTLLFSLHDTLLYSTCYIYALLLLATFTYTRSFYTLYLTIYSLLRYSNTNTELQCIVTAATTRGTTRRSRRRKERGGRMWEIL